MNGTTVASPPDLVGTSGTSSSTATTSSTEPSSFHLDGSIINDLNDFEEIGLGDDHEVRRDVSQKARPGRVPVRNGPATLRDLTHLSSMKKGPFPLQINLPLQSHSADHLHVGPSPSVKSSRRSAAQSTPAVHTTGTRARSPGPVSAVPPSPALSGIIAPSMPGPNGPSRRISPSGPKRASWSGTRKTSEQLEEEYDSDDDVPPDTIFYNVPLSPHSSKAVSATPSPERESSGADRNVAPKAPETGPRPDTSSGANPGPATNPVEVRGRPESRAKNWNDAMRDLGAEAKELSEALERHADKEMEQVAQGLQKRAEHPPRKKSPPRPQTVELPPLQMTNGMIDPLPISKEKEAVLSRTRPSWLPPKPKDEERRHLKEYQRMMRRSQEAERKRVEKERMEQEEKDRIKNDINRVWEQRIIPNFSRACRTQEARELWWKGVAEKCRGRVWQMSFGNHLAVSPETFRLALKRAKEIEAGVKKSPEMYSPRERELFTSIRRDAKKTFPELHIFQEDGPLHDSLLDVLMAYSMYRSDVGYVYGTHVVAGILLLNLNANEAFVTLANILNRPLPLAFFTQDEGAMSRAYSLFLKAFQYKLPSLFRHINTNLAIPPTQYLEPMFLTLFALHCPVDITSRIWDVYSFEGDAFLVRTAVGILATLESKLYGSREEVLKILGWSAKPLDLGTEDDFMQKVRAAGKEDPQHGAGEHL